MSQLAYEGLLLGFCTFLTIGIFHPIVVKAEYYFGTRLWWAFLFCGLAGVAAAPFLTSVFWSALSAIVGFSCLWSILELFEQRQRVVKGWFPMNPNRRDEYPNEVVPFGGYPRPDEDLTAPTSATSSPHRVIDAQFPAATDETPAEQSLTAAE